MFLICHILLTRVSKLIKNMILSFFQKQESSKVEVTANRKEMEANGAMLVRILTTFVPKQFPNIKLQSLPGLIK